jgi:hypothetical protein
MPLLVVVVAVVAGWLLRQLVWALAAVLAAWVFAVVMVGWGPATNSGVHLDSIGFWGPWGIVLAVSLGLAFGAHTLRSRRARSADQAAAPRP